MRRLLDRFGALLSFLVLFLIGFIWFPDLFRQPENLRNLFGQSAPVGIVAVGMTLVIAAGGIDLSVGSAMALVGVFALTWMNRAIGGGQPDGLAVGLAALSALGLGLAVGTLNGLLVTVGRLAPFIATLAGLVAYRSVAQAQVDSGEVRAMGSAFSAFGQNGLPVGGMVLYWPIFLWLGLAALFDLVLRRTPFGRTVIATGGNEAGARYSAIPTARVRLLTYTLLGGCVGLAAFSLGSRLNSVSSSGMGLFYELDAIAAVVIGGTPLAGGRGRVWGTVVGVLLLAVINNLLIGSGVSTYWQGAVKGAIILFAVLIQRRD